MKAIFPCFGSLIMTKNDIENIKDYYDSRQISNNDSLVISENKFFNYFNDDTTFILDNVTPLTVSKLKKVLGISNNKVETNSQKNLKESENIHEDEELIDDDSIFSNPFFTTLKPVD